MSDLAALLLCAGIMLLLLALDRDMPPPPVRPTPAPKVVTVSTLDKHAPRLVTKGQAK